MNVNINYKISYLRNSGNINFTEDGKYKASPESIKDISEQWMEWAMKKNKHIGSDVMISNVCVTTLSSEGENKDAGGMTDAKLLRISIDYAEPINDNGNKAPISVVAKVLFQIRMFQSLNLKNRIVIKKLARIFGDKTEEEYWRTEARFCQEVIPLIENRFQCPKIFYIGIKEVSDRSQFSSLVLNTSPQVGSVIIMEDLNSWEGRSYLSNILSGGVHRKYSENMLRNIAVLHSSFWGKKSSVLSQFLQAPAKCEALTCRAPKYSRYAAWNRRKFTASSKNCQRGINTMIHNWSSHRWASIHKDIKKPSWITIPPSVDGSFPILKDPIVLEMLHLFGIRYPKFSNEVVEEYYDKHVQTLLHGDFHHGNHMYGSKENEGKIIVLDFQCVGLGRVVSDLVEHFIPHTSVFSSIDDLLSLMKIYHNALIENGVDDYGWNEFKKDLIVGSIEYTLKQFIDLSDRTPKKLTEMLNIFGEKEDQVIKQLDYGMLILPIINITNIYLHDKVNFLESNGFLSTF